MALSIAGTNALTLKRGEYAAIAAAALSVVDGDSVRIASLPTRGELRINGVPARVGDTLTNAQITAGALVYFNNGLNADNDSFTVVAQDDGPPVVLSTPADTFAITVNASLGWLTIISNVAGPVELTVFDQKIVAEQTRDGLLKNVAGNVTVVELTTALNITSLFGANQSASAISALQSRGLRDNPAATRMAWDIVRVLNLAANSDFKTVVTASGAAIELESSVWNALTQSQQQRWRNIKDGLELDTNYYNWFVALEMARRTLNL